MACGCGTEAPDAGVRCAECGTECCPACALKMDARAYCRGCGTTQPAAA
jgi:hypothetical protein